MLNLILTGLNHKLVFIVVALLEELALHLQSQMMRHQFLIKKTAMSKMISLLLTTIEYLVYPTKLHASQQYVIITKQTMKTHRIFSNHK